jgi:hypothetical protein
MTPAPPSRTFRFSPLELLLGIGVILGLAYMVYLFGFQPGPEVSGPNKYMGLAAQRALSDIIVRQSEINEDVRNLSEKIARLDSLDSDDQLAQLKAELNRLSQSLDLLEARLGEIARILPLPRPPEAID